MLSKNKLSKNSKNKKKSAIRVITALVAAAISAGIAGCGSGSGTVPTVVTPNIGAISPNSATLGGPAFTLTLNGSNFATGAEATFNGSAVPSEFVSATQVIAIIPASAIAAAGTFQVTASNPGSGANASVMFTVNNPLPAIATLQPSSATTGGLAFSLTVHGSNFLPVSQVEWNGSSRTTTFVSSSQLQAHIMAADLAAVAKVAITVSNPTPGGGNSNSVNFTVPAATITFESTGALDGSDAANTNKHANVWTVKPDGSGATPLIEYTFAGGTLFPSPVWSPDGSKVAFLSDGALDGTDMLAPNGTQNIWVMNADGSGRAPITKLTSNGTQHFDPAWSPDGSKIAFDSNRALDGTDVFAGTMNIWVMNADGSNPIPLTDLTGANSRNPSWSPDGSKIAFASDRAVSNINSQGPNHTFNIWVVNSDGSGRTGVQGSGSTPLTKLTALGASCCLGSPFSFDPPVWSPDGTKIAFESSRALDGSDAANGTSNIWVMNANGSSATPLTRLTTVGANSFGPAWSPDGSKIAFASAGALDGSDAANTSATNNVWIINADGSGRTPVTKLTGGSFTENIIWSPGGDKFLFDSNRTLDGNDGVDNTIAFVLNIWIMNADGSGATPLTKRTASGAGSDSPKQP